MKIICNKAKCKKCGDIIESKHIHNYVRCSCGSISVDGGRAYLKRGLLERDAIEEMSETVGEVILEIGQDDGGLEVILKVEHGSKDDVATQAIKGMQNLIDHAKITNHIIFKYEFVPYHEQDYRLSFKGDTDYDTEKLNALIKKLEEFDTFRVEYY